MCFHPNIANAQTSAGQLLQEIQSQRPDLELPAPVPNEPLKPKLKAPVAGEVSVVVHEFRFVGNDRISSQQLQKIVEPYLEKRLTLYELNAVAALISAWCQEHGYLVKAFLPKQDVTDGVITIQLIEAKLGGIEIDNKSARFSDNRVTSWIRSHISEGQTLSLDDLDRALLTINDLPDINVVGTLKQGTEPGQTVLHLTVTDKPLVDGFVSADNFGDQSTGKVRGSALAAVNGPLGLGEQMSVYGIYSEGLTYGRLTLNSPLGSDGFRFGINGSAMSYRVINQSFQSLWANGSAYTGGIEASYPIIRSRPKNLMFVANWDYSSFGNWNVTGQLPDQTYAKTVAVFGLTGNLLDQYLGGGVNVGSLLISAGNVNKDTIVIANNAGGFSKLRYGYNRLQQTLGDLSAYLSVSGQWASKNMDSSEQLYLGGPYAVRAYATGQGAASQGNLVTGELRQKLPYQTQMIAFYDFANVQTWKSDGFAGATPYNSYILQGFGAGITWLGPKGFNLKATWAQRTGALTQQVAQYLAQNGGSSSNRVWLSASLPF